MVTPSLPRSDPITTISLAELLKDVVKTIQATAHTPQYFVHEDAEHQAANDLRPAFKTVDEVYAVGGV